MIKITKQVNLSLYNIINLLLLGLILVSCGKSKSSLSFLTSALPSLTVSNPSSALIQSGPITYNVTYSDDTDEASINLTPGDITIGGSDFSGCSVNSVSGTGLVRNIIIENCTGTGTVHISIGGGTSSTKSGVLTPAFGPSVSFQIDNTGPEAPTGITLGTVPSGTTLSPTVTYVSGNDIGGSTASSHEVRIERTSDSSLVLDWTTHISGNAINSLTLNSSTQYTVFVRSLDTFNNVGTATSGTNWVTDSLTCPANYVLVPQDSNYTSSDFCVMKYEAKAEINAGGSFDSDGLSVVLADYIPASVASNQPWRSINRDDARSECQSLGPEYDLISNAQWQTIARNLEQQGANWTSGIVGTGCMFQGNKGSATGACGYNGGNPAAYSTDPTGIFTLSNSETIHDFAGNVWEWVRDNNSTNYGSTSNFSTVTAISHTATGTLDDGQARNAKDQFGPLGSYSTANVHSGLGRGFLNASAGAVLRGGTFNSEIFSGVFAVSLAESVTSNSIVYGFRCVYE